MMGRAIWGAKREEGAANKCGRGRGAYGQQPVWPRAMWAPQQTPACVCANARRQSFWKQHELQPADARLRLLSATATEVDSSASAEQLTMATIKIAFLIARKS